jgi:hypothetical protein
MCDYSLHLVTSRPAKVADKLVTTKFAMSTTRGFAAIGEPNVAVCLRPQHVTVLQLPAAPPATNEADERKPNTLVTLFNRALMSSP